MVFDICFYKYYSNRLSQYPTLDYAQDIIIENLKLTFPLNGKRQLSIIKRGDGDCIRLYQIYNHVYNKGADSFLCLTSIDFTVPCLFRHSESTAFADCSS